MLNLINTTNTQQGTKMQATYWEEAWSMTDTEFAVILFMGRRYGREKMNINEKRSQKGEKVVKRTIDNYQKQVTSRIHNLNPQNTIYRHIGIDIKLMQYNSKLMNYYCIQPDRVWNEFVHAIPHTLIFQFSNRPVLIHFIYYLLYRRILLPGAL